MRGDVSGELCSDSSVDEQGKCSVNCKLFDCLSDNRGFRTFSTLWFKMSTSFKLIVRNARQLVAITKNHEKMLCGKAMNNIEIIENG